MSMGDNTRTDLPDSYHVLIVENKLRVVGWHFSENSRYISLHIGYYMSLAHRVLCVPIYWVEMCLICNNCTIPVFFIYLCA